MDGCRCIVILRSSREDGKSTGTRAVETHAVQLESWSAPSLLGRKAAFFGRVGVVRGPWDSLSSENRFERRFGRHTDVGYDFLFKEGSIGHRPDIDRGQNSS